MNREEALAWISTHVVIVGEVTTPHVRPWSTVLRVPTTDGIVWFKAPVTGFDYEAALLELIVPLAPSLVTEVIASRADTGWLLMADAGERAHEKHFDWSPALEAYAGLQAASAALVDELLAVGVVDLRIAMIGERIETLLLPALTSRTAKSLRNRLPRLLDELAPLEGSTLPVTLDHGDLHEWNVFMRDGHVRILDWGDANVAHPLFSLSVEMEPSARAAYLSAWEELGHAVAAEAEIVTRHRLLIRTLEEVRSLVYEPAHAENIEAQIAWYLENVV